MPQPLAKLLDNSKPAGIRTGLPVANTLLCTHAMNVIALWAVIERDLAGLISNFTPGKSAPIARLFFGSNAETPKTAIRNALAESMLPPEERAVFDALMGKHETCFKLRNPLAHWTLAHCAQLPDVIVAIDPRVSVQITAEHDEVTDSMVLDFSDPAKAHLPVTERISEEGITKMLAVYRKHIDEMYAYRIKDLEDIAAQMLKLTNGLRALRIIIKLRTLGASPERRASELRRLSQELGLPQPTEA